MRRLDILNYGLGLLVLGPALYFLLQAVGLSAVNAGLWVQGFFTVGLVGWVFTYLFRVVFSKMTYSTQLKDYREAVLEKRAEEYVKKMEKEEEQEQDVK